MRRLALACAVPYLVLALAVGGAVVGAGLCVGWLLVRREESSGDDLYC